MQDNSKFIQKQDRLNSALEKVKNHLQYLADKYHGNGLFSQYKGKEAEEIEKWNDWHDLEYRIKNRLWDNYHEHQQWHFQTFGWAVLKD
jgi:hypothetical protein